MERELEKEWEVWAEGYAATRERGGAVLLGVATAKTFKEACAKIKLSEPQCLDLEHLTYWACKLYDNKHEAQKAFG